MSTKTISILIGIALIATVIIAVVASGNETPAPATPDPTATSTDVFVQPTATSTSTMGTSPVTATYTLAQVSMHTNAQSCWSIVSGKIYELTSWIKQHPGGADAILKICGKDGTALFTAQHGGMQKQADQLATFKIGVLVQ